MSDEENLALVIKAGAEQLFAPLQKLLDQLLGPAATEVGLGLGDSVKVWRLKRQIRLLQELKRLIDTSGLEVKPIPPRVFFPALEAASIEDDDDMQSRWAALLANAATGKENSVQPSFVEILRQLTPEDARLLDRYFSWQRPSFGVPIDSTLSFDNLLRLGLIRGHYKLGEKKGLGQRISDYGTDDNDLIMLDMEFRLTEVAVKFVEACRAPKNKG